MRNPVKCKYGPSTKIIKKCSPTTITTTRIQDMEAESYN